MTKSEYQELVEFLALRFERIDRRFDAMDERFDAMDERFSAGDKRSEGFEERLHRVEILGEDTLHQVYLVAEGVATMAGKLDEFRSEVADSFREHRDLLRTSHRDLDLRLTSVERHVSGREAD